MTTDTLTPCGKVKWALDVKIKMNILKVRNTYLQIYKEIRLLLKTYEEIWSQLDWKKALLQQTKNHEISLRVIESL